MMHPWGTYGWGLMWLGVAVFLALISVGMYFLLSSSARSSDHDSALLIARERYARGEITAEEYEMMKKELE